MKRILEWEDNYEDNSYGTQSISEDAIIEISEISRIQGSEKVLFKRSEILANIPDSKLKERIQYYRSVIIELESELTSRSLDNKIIPDRDYDYSISDIGSLRYLSSEFNFEMGLGRKERRRNSNRLATTKRTRKSMAIKLNDFINKLTLTEDEKVNLLEEWRKITDEK